MLALSRWSQPQLHVPSFGLCALCASSYLLPLPFASLYRFLPPRKGVGTFVWFWVLAVQHGQALDPSNSKVRARLATAQA